jgi:adenine-specific DNA glycosylase
VSNRIGIAEGDDPEVVEQQLCAAMPKERWTRTSDTLILHGRRVCRPKPLCDQCAVRDDCDYFRLVIARARDGKAPKTKAAKLANAAKLAKTTMPSTRGSKSVRTARR